MSLNAGAPSSTDVEARFDLLALLPVSEGDKTAALAWLVGLLIGINLTVSLLSALRGLYHGPHRPARHLRSAQ